jgi:hypothetical protein
MGSDQEEAVCEFAMTILAARVGEALQLVEKPDRRERNKRAVDQLWHGRTTRFAVEHTRLESFEGQIANEAHLGRLIVPVRELLAGRVPGTFGLGSGAGDTTGPNQIRRGT